MPFTRRLISAAAATLVVAAGLTVPASSALAVPASAPSLTVTDISGNATSNVATGTALPVTATAPITSPGQTGQSIETTWDAAKASVDPSSIVTPEGWTAQYTTDGATWSGTQPSDPSTISGIRADGAVASDGIANGLQVSTASGSGSVQVSAGNFQGSSGGDGWDAFDAGNKVLNVWHHNGGNYNLDCHDKLDGTSCGDVYSVDGYQTSGAATGAYVGGKVYSMVGSTYTGEIGTLCTNVSAVPFTSCGFTPLTSGADPSWTSIGSQVLTGTRLYAPVVSPTNQLLCFDVATQAACIDQPYDLSAMGSIGWAVPAFSVASDGKLFITGSDVLCFDAATGLPCSGNWPIWPNSYNMHSFEPMYDASGTLVGICQVWNGYDCWDLDANAAGTPPGLAAALSANPVGQMITWAQFLTTNHRFYWFSDDPNTGWGANNCYDWASDAPCAGFTQHVLNYSRYAMRQDSANPNCIWHNGDNGQLGSFDATTGAPGCTTPVPVVSIPYTNVVPRLSCAEVGRVREWKSITITAPSGIDVTTLKLTVDDSTSTPVAGYVDLAPNASGAVDLSALPVSSTGTQPTFLVTVPGATTSEAAQLTAAVRYASDPPQICYNLTTNHDCPTLSPGLSAGPDVASDDLVVAGKSVATVASVGSTTPMSASVTQADVSGCVGGVSGSASRTYPGGSTPLAGSTVDLLAPDSTIVGTTTTAGDGSYGFANVNPAAYQVRIAGVLQTASVVAAGSVTANVAIPVANPVASDIASTTLQNTATTFSTSVTTDPSTGVDAASLRFLDASDSSYGSTLTVSGEGVWSATSGGSVVFTPATGFTGHTTPVTYRVADLNGTTTTAQASVTVLAVLPTAKPVHASGVQGDTLTLTPDAQSAAVALDAASLRVLDPATGNGVTSLTVAGVGTYSVDSATGTVRFVPLSTFSGADTQIYQVLDALGRKASATITVVLTPLAPAGGTSTGKAGQVVSGGVTGVPGGSVLTVPAATAGASSVTVSGQSVLVAPAPGFAGVIIVPVTVTHGSASVTVQLTFNVTPAAVGKGKHTIDRSGNSVVSWTRSASAGVTYLVRVNGKVVCSTTKTSCRLHGLKGPKAVVKVTAVAQGVLRSSERRLPYKFTGCTAVGAAHFDTASFALTAGSKARIAAFARTLKVQGFTHVCLTGYTDSRASADYNRVLSHNRVSAVGGYLAAWAKNAHLHKPGMKMNYLGEYYPASTNNSDAGRAANRRVTLSLG